MTDAADLLADRRKLRRRLTLWRTLAFAGAVVALLAIGVATGGPRLLGGGDYVARVAVKGLIAGEASTLRLIERLSEDRKAAAVLVTVDSPGGTTTGSEALHESLRRLAEKKPIIAVVDGMAASGGYIAAIAAPRIVVRETALVGSIGVLVQYPNFVKLLDNLGVRMEEVKSSPLKAAPNPFEPTTPEARAALQYVVADSYDWFKKLVRARRNLSEAELAAVADGRVHTGRQALALKLADEIGGEKSSPARLAKEKGIDANLPVRDRRPVRESDSLRFWSLAEEGARIAGLPSLAAVLGRIGEANEVARLDGLVAIWHPSPGKSPADQ